MNELWDELVMINGFLRREMTNRMIFLGMYRYRIQQDMEATRIVIQQNFV